MTLTMIFSSVLLTGIGCGIGCGSISTPFLLSRMVGEQLDSKNCIRVSLLFLMGKTAMLALLGLLSALIGGTVLTCVQSIYPNVTKWIFRLLLICTAALLLFRTLRKPECGHCKSCAADKSSRLLTLSYPLTGAIYAAIPCTPLVLALTYAATMKPVMAVLLLVGFGLVNSAIPVLLYAPLTGVIVKKIREEIPQLMKYVQFAAVVALLALCVVI